MGIKLPATCYPQILITRGYELSITDFICGYPVARIFLPSLVLSYSHTLHTTHITTIHTTNSDIG